MHQKQNNWTFKLLLGQFQQEKAAFVSFLLWTNDWTDFWNWEKPAFAYLECHAVDLSWGVAHRCLFRFPQPFNLEISNFLLVHFAYVGVEKIPEIWDQSHDSSNRWQLQPSKSWWTNVDWQSWFWTVTWHHTILLCRSQIPTIERKVCKNVGSHDPRIVLGRVCLFSQFWQTLWFSCSCMVHAWLLKLCAPAAGNRSSFIHKIYEHICKQIFQRERRLANMDHAQLRRDIREAQGIRKYLLASHLFNGENLPPTTEILQQAEKFAQFEQFVLNLEDGIGGFERELPWEQIPDNFTKEEFETEDSRMERQSAGQALVKTSQEDRRNPRENGYCTPESLTLTSYFWNLDVTFEVSWRKLNYFSMKNSFIDQVDLSSYFPARRIPETGEKIYLLLLSSANRGGNQSNKMRITRSWWCDDATFFWK